MFAIMTPLTHTRVCLQQFCYLKELAEGWFGAANHYFQHWHIEETA